MTTHPAPPERELVALLADELAQEIRRVDGSHTLGAGALAEALAPFIIDVSTRAATVPQGVSVDALDAARLDWMVRNSARIIWSYGDTVCDVRWTPPDDVMRGNGGFSDWTPGTFTDWRTAIDAAMNPPPAELGEGS